ncbi:MAG TPA: PrgI family protein [Candidatus Saccharimonadales bacterium]|nr:PrgI family protein [Candidatus Saccharimonadales bacterium]
MKSTVVPAQVTTVEDKVTGNLSITQLMLLIVPLFLGSAIFIVLPPFFDYATYKLGIIACVAVASAVLAIRIKEQILLSWIVMILRYNLRPRFFVFDKNSQFNRDLAKPVFELKDDSVSAEQKPITKLSTPTIPELFSVENLISTPEANFTIKRNKKGDLSVYITEVK